MYRMMLIRKILEIRAARLSTNQIVDACGISKQGFAQMMRRLNIFPCDVQKTRGQYGLYIWDMKQVKAAMREEVKVAVLIKVKE